MLRVVVALAVVGFGLPAHADEHGGTPFDRGRIALGVALGSQAVVGYRYFIGGGSVGYYVLDGLEVELGGALYFGDGPSIRAATGGVRYVAQPLVGKWPVVPYGGVFSNRWFIGDPYDDVATIGARAGVIYLSGRILVGIGIAYAHVVSDCVQNCDQVYPDALLGFTF